MSIMDEVNGRFGRGTLEIDRSIEAKADLADAVEVAITEVYDLLEGVACGELLRVDFI